MKVNTTLFHIMHSNSKKSSSLVAFITVAGLIMVMMIFGVMMDVPLPQKTHQPTYSFFSSRVNQTQVVPSPQVCLEKTRVAFIKVHKAASTTVTSIIQRYGLNHHLTFALPTTDLYHIGLYQTFDPVNVRPLPEGKVYEALCQHVVYNREAFRKYLPPDIAVIAAVREPFQRFVSAFRFFGEYRAAMISKGYKNGDSINMMREFMRNPIFYEPLRFKRGSLAYNRMSFDLGLPKNQYTNSSFVDQYIQLLDEDMTLVLVAEYFDESLVLLKRIMCWSTKDILYQVRHKGPNKLKLPEDLKTAHRKIAPSEYQIYDHFKTKFHRLYSREEFIAEEVQVFKDVLQRVTKFCSSAGDHLQVAATKFDPGFTFNRTDCYFLRLEETAFVRHLSKLQSPSRVV